MVKKNKKRNQKKYIKLLLLFLFISVGFALITNNLSIFGTTILKGKYKGLDIYFDNVKVLHGSTEYKPKINPANRKEVTYNVRLEKPGDYYEFTVDAVNGSEMDATIENVELSVNSNKPEEELPYYFTYSLTYADNTQIEPNRDLNAGESVKYKLKLTFEREIKEEDLPQVEQDINMSITIECTQKDYSLIIDKDRLHAFGVENTPTQLIFVDTGVSNPEDSKYRDVSKGQDKTVLAWMSGDIMYVSANEAGVKAKAPVDSTYLLGGFQSDYNYWTNNLTKIDVSKLDTSDVTNMNQMFKYTFYNAETYELIGLKGLDTSKVTTMNEMFESFGTKVTNFELDLSNWNVSNVTSMSRMFSFLARESTTFKLNVSGWNTIKVKNMDYQFYWIGDDAEEWNIVGISDWKTDEVTNMSHMFYCAGYSTKNWHLESIKNWNVSNVTDMESMFGSAGTNSDNFELDLSGWDARNVKSMKYMFHLTALNTTGTFKINLSGINAENVTTLLGLFNYAGENAKTVELDLTNFKTPNVKDMSSMFERVAEDATTWSIKGLSELDTHSVTNMSEMFYSLAGNTSAPFAIDLSEWNTSNVTDMRSMFSYSGYAAKTYSLGDITKWDTSNVKNMNTMFYNAVNKADYSLDLSGWNVDKVTTYTNFNSGPGSKITPPVWVK